MRYTIPIKINFSANDNLGSLVQIPNEELLHTVEVSGGNDGSSYSVKSFHEINDQTYLLCMNDNTKETRNNIEKKSTATLF